MKKIIFTISLILLFALLMGGSCGPKEEPLPELPSEETTTQPEEPMEDTEPIEEPEVERLTHEDFKKAYFDFDKYNIRPDARTALEHNAQLMKEYPSANIVIEGHCDERGTVEYNLALGERRAKAVKDYLVSLGINSGRMETISYGKERPVDLGHNEVAWQKNRRAEFRVK